MKREGARLMRSRWWQAVAAVGVLEGTLFVALAAIDDLGLLAQAAIVVVAAALTIRGSLVGVLVVGALCLIEVVFVPFYDRATTIDWIGQVLAWILGVTGLVAVAGVLLERRRPGR
jgi:hypothetical protein